MLNLICKVCGKPRNKGRKLCDDCAKESAKLRAKKSYMKNGLKNRAVIHICPHCKTEFSTYSKDSQYCDSCKKLVTKRKFLSENYTYSNDGTGRLVWEHRVLAENILGDKMLPKDVVHHLNSYKKDNDLSNLIVLGNSAHARLHKYINRISLPVLNVSDAEYKDFIKQASICWLNENSIIYTILEPSA